MRSRVRSLSFGVGLRTTHFHCIQACRPCEELGRRLVLENPSRHVEFASPTIPERKVFTRMAEEADCGPVLDVNNVHVSSCNHGFDPCRYLAAILHGRVVICHLAGPTNLRIHIGSYEVPFQAVSFRR